MNTGDGSVEALFNALNSACGIAPQLEIYRVQAVTKGAEALGEVSVTARYDHPEAGEMVAVGSGVAPDVVEASAQAWLAVINQISAGQGKHREVSQTTV